MRREIGFSEKVRRGRIELSYSVTIV